MANEAVIIELFGGGRPIRFTCANGTTIAKGTLLKLTDPRTAIATGASGDPFCGIAAHEKLINDGSTSIAAYTEGIFDLLDAGAGFTVGAAVSTGGVNTIKLATEAETVTGAVVGRSLETAGAAETVAVAVGVYA